MKIKVNETKIEVTDFDTEKIILDRYALVLDEALPEYFHVKTKDFRMEHSSKLAIDDIRTELKKLDKNYEKFFQ